MNAREYKKFLKSLPKKRTAAAVLFWNTKKELLMVKPTYKSGWSIPGGIIEDDESPHDAAVRETKEEIGIMPKKLCFVCIDYVDSRQAGAYVGDDFLHFLFDGGKLSESEIKKIRLQESELSAWKFVSKKKALSIATKRLSRRLKVVFAHKKDTPLYAENGKKV